MPHAKSDNTSLRSSRSSNNPNSSNNNYSNSNMSTTTTTATTNSVKTTTTPITNGEKSTSAFVTHLTSYPLISDGISTYKSNPYGAKSLSIANSAYTTAYDRFHPFAPYLATPYSYVAPYLAKADSLGESGLTKLESNFPIVKASTSEVKDKVVSVAGLPFVYVNDGKAYVAKIYGESYEKSQGNDVTKRIRAVIVTEIKVAGDVFKYFTDLLQSGNSYLKQNLDKQKTK